MEGALWAAVRALEEQASLAQGLAERSAERGHTHSEERFGQRAGDARRQAEVLREATPRTHGADTVEADA